MTAVGTDQPLWKVHLESHPGRCSFGVAADRVESENREHPADARDLPAPSAIRDAAPCRPTRPRNPGGGAAATRFPRYL